MSKKALKDYLSDLKKRELENQIIDLYERFKEVKTFYDFVFNPKEEKLLAICKTKIAQEYFPVNNRKPKMRRSVAQKQIKHFIQLGVNPLLITDVMLYNIEVAQTFSEEKRPKQTAFYKSMHKSFDEAITFITFHALLHDYKTRIVTIFETVKNQNWDNLHDFETTLDRIL